MPAKSKLTTTQQGYGWPHRKARAAAMTLFRDGDLCHFCHRPMYRTQKLHYDHNLTRTSYRGMAHASCNTRDGAIRGNKARGQAKLRQTIHSRVW